MAPITFSPFFIALGWSLLHTMWQGGLLWLVYLAITHNGTRKSPALRHNMALVLNLLVLILLGANLYFEYRYDSLFLLEFQGSRWSMQFLSSYLDFIQIILPWGAALYLLGLVVLLTRFGRQYFYIRTIRTSNLTRLPAGLRLYADHCRAILGINKSVELWISQTIQTPLTIGFWKPLILIPVSAISHLSLAQTEAIILHELQHIRRNDYLLNILLSICDMVLFFNPFCRYFSETIRREREHHCDDLVLQFRHQPDTYATALLLLEKNRSLHSYQLALEATGNRSYQLLHRIRRIFTGQTTPIQTGKTWYSIVLVTVLFLITGFFAGTGIVEMKSYSAQDQYFIPQQLAQTNTTQPNNISRVRQITTTNNIPSATTPEDRSMPEFDIYEEALPANPFANLVAEKTAANSRDYSLASTDLSASLPSDRIAFEGPFVPDNSFRYQFMQDTSRPQQKEPGPTELKLQIEKNKTLQALESLNWLELERKLKAQGLSNLDMEKIHEEIRRSLEQLDWKKIEEEAQQKLKLAQLEAQLKQNYLEQLQRFNEAKAIKERQKQLAEEMILQEHFNQNESLRKIQQKKQLDSARTKRIVII